MPRARIAPLTPADVLPHWEVLVETIGERRAGSAAEHRAAAYICSEFKRAGADTASLEAFDCNSLLDTRTVVEVLDGDVWRPVTCEVLVGSPSTKPEGRVQELELVWVEMPEQSARLKPGALKGKALLLFGPLATDTENHKRVVRSGAEIVLWVDDRIAAEWPKSDAILPVWAKRHGKLPTVAVGFQPAYGWRCRGVNRVRAMVQTRHAIRDSYNVLGEFEGSDPKAGIVALGCHYDTQCGNPGADDNGSGTVALLAVARKLGEAIRTQRFRRTIRLIAFGTEEQLSVGSRAYALQHRAEMKRHKLMLNYDSLASALGHTRMLVSGSAELERWALRGMAAGNAPSRVSHQVTPFADHFPFNVFGVPSIWYYRLNTEGIRWQHHGPHDDLSTISPVALCEVVNASLPLIAEAADRPRLPFEPGMRPEDKPLIRRFAKELFDM